MLELTTPYLSHTHIHCGVGSRSRKRTCMSGAERAAAGLTIPSSSVAAPKFLINFTCYITMARNNDVILQVFISIIPSVVFWDSFIMCLVAVAIDIIKFRKM